MDWLIIALKILAFTGLGISILFALLAVMLVVTKGGDFGRTRCAQLQPSQGDFLPPVTLLKPICSSDADLAENLRSFCRQDYPMVEILLGIADENDPAFCVAQQIRNEFPATAGRPALKIVIVTGAPPLGANPKVANLAHMATTAAERGGGAALDTGGNNEIWVVSDSDVRVSSDWLRQIVGPFADEQVGLTSCFYRMANPPNLFAALEAFQVNVDLLGGVLIARYLFRLPFALGATMAMRREAVEKIGGFEALADYLADDYQLGYKISQVGYRVGIANHVVDIVQAPMSWREMWEHQLRWARTFRVCSPVGYFWGILSNGLLWGTVFWIINPPIGWIIWVATLMVRLISSQILFSCLTGQKTIWKYFWVAPLRDCMNAILWIAAHSGNTVRWRGKTFRLSRDGKMKEVTNAKR